MSERNFAKLEEYMKFDHLRPYYKWACHNVHSGPKGITFKLGLLNKSEANQILVAGPSNYGLADPGQSCAISLGQITTCLLYITVRALMTVKKKPLKSTVEILVKLIIILDLIEEISIIFCEVQSQIKSEEEELEKS